MTLTTPLLRVACHHRLRCDTVYLHAKFDDSNFILASEILQISLGCQNTIVIDKIHELKNITKIQALPRSKPLLSSKANSL